ncbi:M20 metallopeptidase family protein [Paenibacillus sp. OSY-SE]|uniref:M20 metallopeptidase family protein n=1 Tax=Paenibacillus sp. OSY-SE TaxID=1196323 RepID=UPI0003189C0B|nr:amidohydrolase [Paenibacillus sp. OSY-SE]
MRAQLINELAEQYDQIVSWRRHLHQHPELSFQETNTAKFIAEQLTSFGIEVKVGVGGGGVIGYLRGKQAGPTIAFRADFDALPIHEENDVPYKSTVDGVMHACGHDGHTSTLLGVAKVLSGYREQLQGTLVFIFQHAEEKPPGGAKLMIEDGALDGVDYIYGAHLSSEIPLGQIGLREGAFMAAADAFAITIQGKGGHGAKPHQTVDALVIGSQLVQALQHIVARRVNPLHSAVVTVGVFQAGTAFNVIADKARMEGTVRTFDQAVREQIETDIRSITKGISEANDAGHDVAYTYGYPALVNPHTETEQLRGLIADLLGNDVFYDQQPSMGAEDFAYYLQHKPGAFFNVGSRNESQDTAYPHHHPRFDIDEQALLVAGNIFLALAAHYLLK